MKRISMSLFVLAGALLTSGCTALFQPNYATGMRNGVSSSLVDYLYPDGEPPPEFAETIPQLKLPLKVGLAFVPGRYSHDEISEATVAGVRVMTVAIESVDLPALRSLRHAAGLDGHDNVGFPRAIHAILAGALANG